MRQFKHLLIAFTATLLYTSHTNAQSGWTQGKGKYYVKTSLQRTSSDSHFSQQQG